MFKTPANTTKLMILSSTEFLISYKQILNYSKMFHLVDESIRNLFTESYDVFSSQSWHSSQQLPINVLTRSHIFQ